MAARYVARPVLRERFVLLSGGQKGYLNWLRDSLSSPCSQHWLWKLLEGRDAVPIRTMVEFIRIAERAPDLDVLEAEALFDTWFIKEGGRDA